MTDPQVIIQNIQFHILTIFLFAIAVIIFVGCAIYVRLTYQTLYLDPITKNYNLNALERYFQRKHQKRQAKLGQVSVVGLKIPNLNKINRTYGYDVGDELMLYFSNRVKYNLAFYKVPHFFSTIRDNTFLIILYGLTESEVIKLTEKIMQHLETPFHVKKYEITSCAIASITVLNEQVDLYKHKKINLSPVYITLAKALETYKKTNKSAYCVFNEKLRTKNNDLRERYLELEKAIKNNEFEPFFQPIMSAVNHEITSFEALCRWRHPQKGYLVPATFLNDIILFELTSLLDYSMLKKSLQQLKLIHRNTKAFVPVSVNFTIETIMESDFVDKVLAVIAEVDIQPHFLIIEITEHSLIKEVHVVNDKIAHLSKHGIKIALDDFGSGYSNLSVLSQLNFDHLKLDRSLVNSICQNDKTSNLIYLMLLNLVEDQNKKLVCEGIETEDMVNVLVNNLSSSLSLSTINEHSLTLQGYFFSKPIPYLDLISYLNPVH